MYEFQKIDCAFYLIMCCTLIYAMCCCNVNSLEANEFAWIRTHVHTCLHYKHAYQMRKFKMYSFWRAEAYATLLLCIKMRSRNSLFYLLVLKVHYWFKCAWGTRLKAKVSIGTEGNKSVAEELYLLWYSTSIDLVSSGCGWTFAEIVHLEQNRVNLLIDKVIWRIDRNSSPIIDRLFC